MIVLRLDMMQETITKMKEECMCPICHETMIRPMMTSCGHTFCSLCWDQFKAMTNGGESCPMCRHTLVNPAVLNKALWNIIQLLEPGLNLKRKKTVDARVDLIYNIYKHTKGVFPYGYKEYMDTKLDTCCVQDITLCRCGLVAMERLVRKEGGNKGRPFSSCPFAKSGCGFFEWLDGTDQEKIKKRRI